MQVTLHIETVPMGALQLDRNGDDQPDIVPFQSSSERFSTKLPGIGASGERILTARFVLVARDTPTYGAVPVNELHLVTDEERRLFQEGKGLRFPGFL